MLQSTSDVGAFEDSGPKVFPPESSSILAELRRLERKLESVLEAPGRSSSHKSVALSILSTHRAIDGAFAMDGLATSPAWDILLEVYAAGTLAVSNAAAGGGCSLTTGLRWLAVLESRGWLHRFDDARDGRRKLVVLSSQGKALVERCLELYNR